MLKNIKDFEKPKTISEMLYHHLKEAIIFGDLRSGQRLQEKEIASRFNVSVTPVREAFRRLSAEDYLIINARKEVIIAEATIKKTQELCAVLTVLEQVAAKGSLENLKEHEIDSLDLMTKQQEQYHERGENEYYLRLDLMIHKEIWQSCGNAFLGALLSDLGEKYAFLCTNITMTTPKPAQYFQFRDHLDIIEALRKRDLDKLTRTLAAHRERAITQISGITEKSN